MTREIAIERPASEYAEVRGWFQIKIMLASKKGFPDRFYARKGRVVLIEYKAPGEPPTAQQIARHKELREQEIEVYVVDNLEMAKAILK
jgi:hypothetical protein